MLNLLTTTQAAEQLGMNRRALTNLINAGILPAIRVGRDWLIEQRHMKKAENRPRPGRRWPKVTVPAETAPKPPSRLGQQLPD